MSQKVFPAQFSRLNVVNKLLNWVYKDKIKLDWVSMGPLSLSINDHNSLPIF